MKLLLYCTKAKPNLWKYSENFLKYLRTLDVQVTQFELGNKVSKKDPTYKYCESYINEDVNLNGKIVAECDFEVEEIEYFKDYNGWLWYTTKSLWENRLQYLSCLSANDLENYLGNKGGYAIHIKNLHIYDEPKELRDYKGDSKGNFFKIIEKAPQNMQMVLNEKLEDCILISIHPEWLCKILNGDKTIEVRKKVLKEML